MTPSSLLPLAGYTSPYTGLTPAALQRTLPPISAAFSANAFGPARLSAQNLIDYITLSLINQVITDELSDALKPYFEQRILTWDTALATLLHEFLLAVWPWLSTRLKDAIRPSLLESMPHSHSTLFACLDPVWPLPAEKPTDNDPVLQDLWYAHNRGSKLSQHDLCAIIEPFKSHRNLPYSIGTLIRLLTHDQLEFLFRGRTSRAFRRLALLCPHAPTEVVDKMIRETRLTFEDTERTLAEPASTLTASPIWLAPINLNAIPFPNDSRLALLTIGAWAQHPIAFSPRMTIQATEHVITMLRQESDQAYADIATLISYRLNARPHDLVLTPIPETVVDIMGQRTTRFDSLATLATTLYASLRVASHSVIGFLFNQTSHHFQEDWIERLSRHRSWHVRRFCAKTQALTPSIRQRLMYDAEHSVAMEVLIRHEGTDKELMDFAKRTDPSSMRSLLIAIKLSDTCVSLLAHHRSSIVRAAVAAFQDLSPATRVSLLKDSNHGVRAAVLLRNDVTTEDILLACPPKTLEIAAAILASDHAPTVAVDQIAARYGKELRERLLGHPNISDQARVNVAVL